MLSYGTSKILCVFTLRRRKKENNVVMRQDMITLAVAPSVCVLRHCISPSGGVSFGRLVSFNEISSALALGTLFSSLAKKQSYIST